MTNELAKMNAPQLALIQSMAPMIHASRLFGVASPEQAAAIMVTAAELGMSPTAGFEFIDIIQGKPALSPRGALALIHRSGLLEAMEIKEDDAGCTVTMKRHGGLTYTSTWTLDEAKRAGLVKPDSGYAKYPRNMCRWRAIGYAADILFPDVLSGLKTADQFGAEIDQTGDIIEGEAEVV